MNHFSSRTIHYFMFENWETHSVLNIIKDNQKMRISHHSSSMSSMTRTTHTYMSKWHVKHFINWTMHIQIILTIVFIRSNVFNTRFDVNKINVFLFFLLHAFFFSVNTILYLFFVLVFMYGINLFIAQTTENTSTKTEQTQSMLLWKPSNDENHWYA